MDTLEAKSVAAGGDVATQPSRSPALLVLGMKPPFRLRLRRARQRRLRLRIS